MQDITRVPGRDTRRSPSLARMLEIYHVTAADDFVFNPRKVAVLCYEHDR